MIVEIHNNALKHKRDFQNEQWENVKRFQIEHQINNGNWLILFFKEGSPEYEEFKNQRGILYINFDITADIITIKEEK